MRRFFWPLIGAFAAILFLAGCGGTAPDRSSNGLPSMAAVLTATSGTVTPPASSLPAGAAPTAGAKAGAPTAVLGATEDAFVGRLGAAGPGSAPGKVDHFGRANGGSCDAFVVTFTQGHASAIRWSSCGAPVPAVDQRLNAAATFLPADTRVGKGMVTSRGEQGTLNTSAILAKTLPAEAFQDCNRKSVAPGTFALIMTSDGWALTSGACP